MSEPEARPHYQRARRDAEKAERRAAILASAATLLESVGFEGFTMAVLAKKAGVAKATLYLYFDTREEVLLTLYVERLEAWAAALLAELHDGMSDAAFVERFQTITLADPSFLTLRGRLESVIEHNVSLACLVAAKRRMRSLLGELAPRVESALGLAAGTGGGLIVALGALQLGAAQSRLSPAIADLDLPADVAEFMKLHTEADVFLDTAGMIVAGVRAAGTASA